MQNGVMPFSLFSQQGRKCAATWIGLGLAVLVSAQVAEGVPIATAMAMVAWGAVQLAMAKNGAKLAVVNLAIYVLIVGFAIASQTDLAQRSESGMGLKTLCDHALAMVLLVGLSINTLSRTVAQLSDER